MLRSVISFLLVLLTLSACTETGRIDAAIPKTLAQVCKASYDLQPLVLVLEGAGKIKGKTQIAVDGAFATLNSICPTADTETLASVLVKGTAAALVISTALKTAQSAQGA